MTARVQPQYKDRIREIARAYRQKYPAMDNLGMLEGIGATLRFTEMHNDGAFDPEHNVVFLNPKISLERQRFTLAHEISHALLLGDEDLLSDIHDDYDGDDLENTIEVLCNVGAAAILVTPDLLERALSRGLSATSVINLMNWGGVSASVALVALAENTLEPAVFALCMPSRGQYKKNSSGETLPSENYPSRSLEVKFAPQSASMKYSLSTGTPIPFDHPIQAAFETSLPLEEISYLPFRSGKKMTARVSAYPEKNRVFAVFLV
jgi:Zn-dependent peptidase ImmA (M78 family)